LTSAFTNQSRVQLNTNVFAGGNRVTVDSQSWSSGFSQQLKWWGASYNVNWTNGRTFSDATNTTFNPSYQTGFQATYTQPLLRDFKIDSTRTSLQTTRIQQETSELSLRGTIAGTLASVRNAYWDLVYAVQAVEAARLALDLANKLVQDNRTRVEIGTMAPIDIVQAEAEAASRQQAVVTAEATHRNAELALKRLIVGGTDDEMWRVSINPVDRPSVVAEPIDLEQAVRNALENRTDLESARKNLESSEISLRSLRNQTLPDLSLQARYTLDGRGGTSIERDRVTNAILGQTPGGYFDALRAIGGFDAPTWNVSLNFSYPIGTSAQEANLARDQLRLQQSQAQLKASELGVATEVTSAALAVRNAFESVQAATKARELSEQRLAAVQSKFEVGMATNYEVVQAQRDLFDARNSELRNQLNYRKALVDFQRVQVSPR
jgi:outer membrane protein TolC